MFALRAWLSLPDARAIAHATSADVSELRTTRTSRCGTGVTTDKPHELAKKGAL